MFYLSRARMGRVMWQEGLSTERWTSTCNFAVRGTEKKVLKVRYSAFTIRNLNPYESKVFYEFLPNNRFVNPNLFIKPVPRPVPVPRTFTCTFLRVTAGSKRTSVQRTSVPSVETLRTRGNTKETCTCILVPVPVPVPRTCTSCVPRTCTCTCTSYSYLYLYLVPVLVLVLLVGGYL